MQKTATKTVDILYRVLIKLSGIIVYIVLSSDGVTRYNVTVVRGKVNSCTCPSYKPCRHMKAVQSQEDARSEQELARRMAEQKAHVAAMRSEKEQEREQYREFEFQCGSYSIPGLY